MSLIQEALRRQQQELEAEKNGNELPPETQATETGTPPLTKEPVPAPADTVETPLAIFPDPDTPSADGPGATSEEPSEELSEAPDIEAPVRRKVATKQQRVLLPLLGALLLLALLGAVVAWAVLYGFRMFGTESAAVDTAAVEAPKLTPVEPDAELVEASIIDMAEAPQAGLPADTPAPEDMEQAGMIEQNDIPPQDTTMPPAPKDAVAQESVTDPLPALPPPDPPEPIIWPDVYVSGVMGTGSGGSAIINGKVYGLNDKVDALTVRGFGRGFVVLEYRGETRQISIGRPIR